MGEDRWSSPSFVERGGAGRGVVLVDKGGGVDSLDLCVGDSRLEGGIDEASDSSHLAWRVPQALVYLGYIDDAGEGFLHNSSTDLLERCPAALLSSSYDFPAGSGSGSAVQGWFRWAGIWCF
ncbi:hypothetical protein KSP39_PZI014057 [Platanthera zijinensis]|uniref:Uncharacterized protein n=1 Tax=Platanthera zijinensis TaxID=2320716 RepID=A0AAP0BCE6_9ASPA